MINLTEKYAIVGYSNSATILLITSQSIDMNERIKELQKTNQIPLLLKGTFGVEKESLRCTSEGVLSSMPHPASWGKAVNHAFITTDFSESQPEFVTPPFESIDEVYSFMKNIHIFSLKQLHNEYLWPYSMPCILPKYDEIPYAYYGEEPHAKAREIYRRGIALRYGKMMQMVSGIHFNFSFSDSLLKQLYQQERTKLSFRDFKDSLYMKVVRNFMRNRWLIVYLFGASPIFHETYKCKNFSALQKKINYNNSNNFVTSFRMSRCGYSNSKERQFSVSYNDVTKYTTDIRNALNKHNPKYETLGLFSGETQHQMNANVLQIENEYYSPIRLKGSPKADELHIDAIDRAGVTYLEARIFDLNPLSAIGIEKHQLYFMHLYMLFCLFEDSDNLDLEERKTINEVQTKVALQGRKPDLLLSDGHQQRSIKEWSSAILEEIENIANVLIDAGGDLEYRNSVNRCKSVIENPSKTPSALILSELSSSNSTFIQSGIEKAKHYKKELLASESNHQYQEQIKSFIK